MIGTKEQNSRSRRARNSSSASEERTTYACYELFYERQELYFVYIMLLNWFSSDKIYIFFLVRNNVKKISEIVNSVLKDLVWKAIDIKYFGEMYWK